MATVKQDVFALVFHSGRAETLKTTGGTYWDVLEHIAYNHGTGSYGSDYPKTLLRNGEPVTGRPTDLAWSYQRDLTDARCKATDNVREKHRPDWMEASPDA